jgi:UDP:flavonoid glycosyltransferase YjiC (YdhE family)
LKSEACEPFLPYAGLLPYLQVVATNGGYGGVQSAPAHGVPLVVAGTGQDKAEIAARVAWAGVGINLKTNTPAPEHSRAAIRRVLSEPGYRSRAQASPARNGAIWPARGSGHVD